MINKLAAYRRKEQITQKEFAEKLGIGTVTLSKWENPSFDLRELSVIKIATICEILHVGIWDLIEKEIK